jgi:[glutamine synthetase] adenylyltransferase / [glutamine synthetase]-adenylyl-L-tyrosine phosphorylase
MPNRYMDPNDSPLALARAIDEKRARELEAELGTEEGRNIGVLLGTAFPPLRPVHGWQVDAIDRLARRGWRSRRSRDFFVSRLERAVGDVEGEEFLSVVRRYVWSQRARIALRELLPRAMGGAPVDETARELSNLAEAAFEVSLAEAARHATWKYGAPVRADGAPSTLVVLGMGKLGGRELNAGSDIDLVLIYDTDDGRASEVTLHEYWTSVVRRAVATMETATEDGFVWRVDLRLRPEGAPGPMVYSWAAAERYYETWGRLWERAALLRARPVAGDLDLGAALGREVIVPFVFRRKVDPSIATTLAELVQRSRVELRADTVRDLKLGRGGIREAEFFVQALQLIWGGPESSLRVNGTLAALERLQGKGLVSDREAHDISHGYLLLRRVEHAIQWRTGVQTHSLPKDEAELEILARIMRFDGVEPFLEELGRSRDAVAELFTSLSPEAPRPPPKYSVLLAQLDQPSAEKERLSIELFADADVLEHLEALGRRPDNLLGWLTRERFPELTDRVLEAIRNSSDPEQAARYLRSFMGRLLSPDAYVSALAEDPQTVSRFVTVLGASAFVGDAIAARPELAEILLFGEKRVSIDEVGPAVDEELAAYVREVSADADPHDRREAFIGALRRAQRRVTLEVAVSDLAGELDTRAVTWVLSALADRILGAAVGFVMGDAKGLSVIAVGKLGGGDIGYGSDLDVLFIYDPASAPDGQHAPEYFSRLAQRIIRLISEPHSVGPGYDLDTRLRPSGSHGLLVTSLASFARYHGVSLDDSPSDADHLTVLSSGAAWERQALLRARACAGDMELGARVIRVAHAAAYERGAPPASEVHYLRMRMERELARERPGRYDLKTGRGGLLDVEFAVQWLQMEHGLDVRVRTTDTVGALHALRDAEYLSVGAFESLRDGYVFLRRLEQRIRIVHGSGAPVLEATATGLTKLARRMGIQRSPTQSEGEALLEAYEDSTSEIRRTYLEVMGVK